MSKNNPTAKQVLLQREMEVHTLELQARYWKANFELKDYYLKDKAIEAQYKEMLAKDMEEFVKKQESQIRELSKQKAVIVNSKPGNN